MEPQITSGLVVMEGLRLELILNGFYVKIGPDSYECVYESGVLSRKQTALNKFDNRWSWRFGLLLESLAFRSW